MEFTEEVRFPVFPDKCFQKKPVLYGKVFLRQKRSDWFFLGRDFAMQTVSMETVISRIYLPQQATY